jgi:threonine dehydratase
MTISLKDIEKAAQRIESAIVNTDIEKSRTLSEITGTELYLKFENLQFTSSFKERGALNKLLQLSEQERDAGVIAMSAGNHAKAVAYHTQRLGIPATIVMPVVTPNVKVEDTQNFQAKVILHGNSFEEASRHAQKLAKTENLTFVHPFDDEHIMAGQGTVALEMLSAIPELECIVVPIGGGGLISGVATAAKTIKPTIQVIGVQVEGYLGTYDAIYGDSGFLGGSTIAEGIAVKNPGKLTMPIIDKLVDDIVVVSEEAIEEAISLLVNIEKTVTEGAGASVLAAVLSHPKIFQGLKTGLILSGANIDTRILASVLMRRLVKKGRIVRYKIRIDDAPGTLSKVSATIGDLGGNILEVFHQRMFSSLPVKEADIYITVETKDVSQSQVILEELKALNYQVTLLKD